MNFETNFPEANIKMIAPESMKDTCKSVSAWKGNQQDGTPCFILKIKPSLKDLKELVENDGSLYLYIIGEQMPPVSLQVENPFFYEDNIPEIYKK